MFSSRLEITVTLTNVYGEIKIYPICEKARLFARLAGTKTLTDRAIEMIKELGYSVKVSYENLPTEL